MSKYCWCDLHFCWNCNCLLPQRHYATDTNNNIFFRAFHQRDWQNRPALPSTCLIRLLQLSNFIECWRWPIVSRVSTILYVPTLHFFTHVHNCINACMLACSFIIVISIMGRLGDEIAFTLYEGEVWWHGIGWSWRTTWLSFLILLNVPISEMVTTVEKSRGARK
jgi:hypothetical protein